MLLKFNANFMHWTIQIRLVRSNFQTCQTNWTFNLPVNIQRILQLLLQQFVLVLLLHQFSLQLEHLFPHLSQGLAVFWVNIQLISEINWTLLITMHHSKLVLTFDNLSKQHEQLLIYLSLLISIFRILRSSACSLKLFSPLSKT